MTTWELRQYIESRLPWWYPLVIILVVTVVGTLATYLIEYFKKRRSRLFKR